MGRSEVKVNVGAVRRHSSEIRGSNSALASKTKTSVSAGTTNFKGYTLGIPCSKSMTRVLSSLTNKIDADCNNLNSAAEAVNKMDRQIAGKFNNNKRNIK